MDRFVIGYSEKIEFDICPVSGNDMYLFIICRDLAKSTFTHVPCGTTWKGKQKMEEHLATCDEELTQELEEIYRVPGLHDVVLTFGWAMFLDGLWHTEVSYIGIH